MRENIENPEIKPKGTLKGANVNGTEDLSDGTHLKGIEKLLLGNEDLWRASDIGKVNRSNTGYKNLDSILPGGGWPKKGLVEIINQCHGVGELQLLIPLMLSVIKQGKWILWVCPPHIVYAPALLQAGIDANQILVVNKAVPCKDALWSMERALRSSSCGLVLAWQTWLSVKVLRRLQLAAETGGTLGFIFKSRDNKYSPSNMRIRVKSITNFDEASITVIKAHDGSRAQSTTIKLYKHHLQIS